MPRIRAARLDDNGGLPVGWTNHPIALGIETMWKDEEDLGLIMAWLYKLENPRPVLSTTGLYGWDSYIFESGSKFYIWERNTDTVEHIEYPTTLEDIIKAMKKNGFRDIKLRELEPCLSDDSDDSEQ